ncbi:hypothetical protein PAN31108_00026 [Pandoraea anhela]|uniref:Uncharacterized protein n=1 Tax=Pandoraea anhela TaxID=2508295 RepID=A0A5E4RBC4_9BURK|nr:hypothetical protein PAN31108_00026 [Pandoraea anhela]
MTFCDIQTVIFLIFSFKKFQQINKSITSDYMMIFQVNCELRLIHVM